MKRLSPILCALEFHPSLSGVWPRQLQMQQCP